jgi:hypothetical protein
MPTQYRLSSEGKLRSYHLGSMPGSTPQGGAGEIGILGHVKSECPHEATVTSIINGSGEYSFTEQTYNNHPFYRQNPVTRGCLGGRRVGDLSCENSVFKFDAGSKLRFGENDEVKIFRGGLTFGLRPSQGQPEFRTRAEPANMAKNSRIHSSIFAEEIAVRIHLLEFFDGSLQSPLQGHGLGSLAHRRTHRNARKRT